MAADLPSSLAKSMTQKVDSVTETYFPVKRRFQIVSEIRSVENSPSLLPQIVARCNSQKYVSQLRKEGKEFTKVVTTPQSLLYQYIRERPPSTTPVKRLVPEKSIEWERNDFNQETATYMAYIEQTMRQQKEYQLRKQQLQEISSQTINFENQIAAAARDYYFEENPQDSSEAMSLAQTLIGQQQENIIQLLKRLHQTRFERIQHDITQKQLNDQLLSEEKQKEIVLQITKTCDKLIDQMRLSLRLVFQEIRQPERVYTVTSVFELLRREKVEIILDDSELETDFLCVRADFLTWLKRITDFLSASLDEQTAVKNDESLRISNALRIEEQIFSFAQQASNKFLLKALIKLSEDIHSVTILRLSDSQTNLRTVSGAVARSTQQSKYTERILQQIRAQTTQNETGIVGKLQQLLQDERNFQVEINKTQDYDTVFKLFHHHKKPNFHLDLEALLQQRLIFSEDRQTVHVQRIPKPARPDIEQVMREIMQRLEQIQLSVNKFEVKTLSVSLQKFKKTAIEGLSLYTEQLEDFYLQKAQTVFKGNLDPFCQLLKQVSNVYLELLRKTQLDVQGTFYEFQMSTYGEVIKQKRVAGLEEFLTEGERAKQALKKEMETQQSFGNPNGSMVRGCLFLEGEALRIVQEEETECLQEWLFQYVADMRDIAVMLLLTPELYEKSQEKISKRLQTEVDRTVSFIKEKARKLGAISAAIAGEKLQSLGAIQKKEAEVIQAAGDAPKIKKVLDEYLAQRAERWQKIKDISGDY